jgi:hypothetical protein
MQPLLQWKSSITYFDHVFVASVVQYAICAHLIVCGLPARLYNIFPHYSINGTVLNKKVLNITYAH